MNFDVITFFEKKGCAGNAKQKAILKALGQNLQVLDSLTHPFTKAELLTFFQGVEVSQWFNTTAPKVKEGTIDPYKLTSDEAIALMLKEPLLIRRPLLVVKGEKMVGFDLSRIQKRLGLEVTANGEDLEGCLHEV